jgi:hypothetical protein
MHQKWELHFSMQLSNFLKFFTIYNLGQSNLKTSYFCARNAILKKIVTPCTKRVIVSHVSGIMDLWTQKYKAKCGALWTYYQISIILKVWYFIHFQIKKCKFFCELLYMDRVCINFISRSLHHIMSHKNNNKSYTL